MNKYKYIKVLQSNYGYGWDDVLEFPEDSTIKERKEMVSLYRVNQKTASHRIIKRRVLNES